MTGLKILPMKRFLGLLSVDSQDPDYMKSSSVDLLVKLTAKLFEEELAAVHDEMLLEDTFELGIYFSY